jgi:aminobenzoyl-glutamate utilization protein B
VTSDAGRAAIATAASWLDEHDDIGPTLSDQVWHYAEPGLCEERSAALLCDALETAGFDVTRGAAGMPTAFVARHGSGAPAVALMCEYDATPGESQRPVPERSPVHPLAAGFTDLHNGIGAASVAAALAAAAAMREHAIPGSLVVFGTPAEKLCLGKPFLARDGFFDGLDAVVAWHPRQYTTAEWDTGPGCYQAEVHEFFGTSSYAASPWTGVSALDALTLMNVIVQFQREHIPPWHRTTVNELVSQGGQHPTSLPNFAQAWYVHRSNGLDGIRYASELLARAGAAAAAALGARHESRIVAATRPWLPNHTMARAAFRGLELAGPPRFPDEMVAFAQSILRELGRPPVDQPFDTELSPPEAGRTAEFHGGADDVTEFCWHAPTARIYVAHGISMAGGRMPNWVPGAFCGTTAAHATVRTASRAVAYTALDVLTDAALRAEATAEHARRLDEVGRVGPLIPPGVAPPIGLDEAPPYVRDHRLATLSQAAADAEPA